MINILIIDDNKETARNLQQYFTLRGNQADSIFDAKEALKMASSKKVETYDYVLLDLYLNGINGLDVYKALENKGLEDKVIFISGCDENSDIFGKVLAMDVPLVVKTFSANAMLKAMIDGSVSEWANDQLSARGIHRAPESTP